MELRLVLTVDDFDEALAFYRDALGLPVLHAWPTEGDARIMLLDGGHATLELVNEAQAAAIDEIEVGRRVAGPVRLAFEVDDSEAVAALTREPKNRALYLYPTKALAQDQARALGELAVPRVRAAIYDGDTPPERRPQIRRWANLVLTNPDMLHVGVLPRHDLWANVLHNLRYVVVDEAHVYRGVFGSHVANVLRRLRRLAHVYGAEPQFLLASATIANPGELAHSLLGLRATMIGVDD